MDKNISDIKHTDPRVSEDEIMDLVKLFEGFSQASTTFAQSYRTLESQLARLSSQLEEQVRLLRRTEGFLSSILANVPAGIMVIDIDGIITLFNPYAEYLTGLKAGEILGQPYNEIFRCRVTDPDSSLYTLTTGSVLESKEKDLAIINGDSYPVRFSTTWITDERGDRSGVLEVFEDMRIIQDMQKRLQQKENLASLGEMAAQVAHELRNPLAGVQGFTQFLEEDLEEDHPASKTAKKIIQGVQEIDQIAGKLLEFTAPVKPEFSQIDIVNLLQDEVELTNAEISNSSKQIDLNLNVPVENVPVTCDMQLIKQAVLNLLKNSMNACEDTGKIEVGLIWNLLKNRVRIIVKDNGMGIEAKDIDNIFNPFFTTRSRGTGLGLSMVKKIMDVHHGEVKVDTKPGEGCRFVLEMPIARLS
ncbi:MAG: ATP-binding protein [Candidatus Electryonea clarkiae]|nr:ATP-binding protein [Candidatus Electryonea clarkiae]MDP8286031.1 ATP-binding protein [Candidatus Electryonea clarkiae]